MFFLLLDIKSYTKAFVKIGCSIQDCSPSPGVRGWNFRDKGSQSITSYPWCAANDGGAGLGITPGVIGYELPL